MAISDEMREHLEQVVQQGDQIKAMFKEQDDVDYEIGDYDEPITQLLGHMNEVMETIYGGWQWKLEQNKTLTTGLKVNQDLDHEKYLGNIQ